MGAPVPKEAQPLLELHLRTRLRRERIAMVPSYQVGNHRGLLRGILKGAIHMITNASSKNVPVFGEHIKMAATTLAAPVGNSQIAALTHVGNQPTHPVALARSEILSTDAQFSQSSRLAIAAKHGVTSNRELRDLEWSLLAGPGKELLKSGSSPDEVLQKLDFQRMDAWEEWWGMFRSDVDLFAFEVGQAKEEVEAGVDYHLVAEKYGIRDAPVLEEVMKVFYEKARQESPSNQP